MMEIHEWHKHPSSKNLFENEISILKRGLGGDFKLIKLDIPFEIGKLVSAVGELSFGNGKKQLIQVVFPSKYPFSPPLVFAISCKIDNNGNLIEPFIPFFFGKGNQYEGGPLCLFESGFWNKDVHNIGWILRRTQKWLTSANSEKGFTKSEIVEEYPYFMKPTGQVLIPKKIEYPKNVKSGLITLTQFKPDNYIYEGRKSIFEQSISKDTFEYYIFEKGITLKSLFPLIGPVLDSNSIIQILKNYFGVATFEGELNKNVALYLPSEDNLWHFFKFKVQRNGKKTIVHVPLYFVARTISDELYLRTKDIFDDKLLSKKKVTIVGLGAIGSEVAKSLAKNGVGYFNLFDKDTFQLGNSVRHAADLFYIGEPKVNVVSKLILRTNPNIVINPYPFDVLNDNGSLEKCLKESDLCIVLTAEDSVEYFINDFYIKRFKIPFIFARASIGAFSGSIQVVDSESACLRCLSLSDSDILPKPRQKIRLSELKPEFGSCSSPALPGSEIDTKEISLQVARISMQCLLKNTNSSYPKLLNRQFYWHGPYGSETKEPFTWERKNLKKHKDCNICK